jgi:hypothetical protein
MPWVGTGTNSRFVRTTRQRAGTSAAPSSSDSNPANIAKASDEEAKRKKEIEVKTSSPQQVVVGVSKKEGGGYSSENLSKGMTEKETRDLSRRIQAERKPQEASKNLSALEQIKKESEPRYNYEKHRYTQGISRDRAEEIVAQRQDKETRRQIALATGNSKLLPKERGSSYEEFLLRREDVPSDFKRERARQPQALAVVTTTQTVKEEPSAPLVDGGSDPFGMRTNKFGNQSYTSKEQVDDFIFKEKKGTLTRNTRRPAPFSNTFWSSSDPVSIIHGRGKKAIEGADVLAKSAEEITAYDYQRKGKFSFEEYKKFSMENKEAYDVSVKPSHFYDFFMPRTTKEAVVAYATWELGSGAYRLGNTLFKKTIQEIPAVARNVKNSAEVLPKIFRYKTKGKVGNDYVGRVVQDSTPLKKSSISSEGLYFTSFKGRPTIFGSEAEADSAFRNLYLVKMERTARRNPIKLESGAIISTKPESPIQRIKSLINKRETAEVKRAKELQAEKWDSSERIASFKYKKLMERKARRGSYIGESGNSLVEKKTLSKSQIFYERAKAQVRGSTSFDEGLLGIARARTPSSIPEFQNRFRTAVRRGDAYSEFGKKLDGIAKRDSQKFSDVLARDGKGRFDDMYALPKEKGILENPKGSSSSLALDVFYREKFDKLRARRARSAGVLHSGKLPRVEVFKNRALKQTKEKGKGGIVVPSVSTTTKKGEKSFDVDPDKVVGGGEQSLVLKTKNVERGKTKTEQKEKVSVKSAASEDVPSLSLQSSVLVPKGVSRSRFILLPASKIFVKQKQIPTQQVRVLSGQSSKSESKVVQVQIPKVLSDVKVVAKTSAKTDIGILEKLRVDTTMKTSTLVKTVSKVEERTGLRSKLESVQDQTGRGYLPKLSTRGGSAGFDVFVRRFGKFSKVSRDPLVRGEALNFGMFKVANTAGATFRIKRSSTTASEGVFRQKGLVTEFRRAKGRGYGDQFVEKNKFRINTPGEVSEISMKGWNAKRRGGWSL